MSAYQIRNALGQLGVTEPLVPAAEGNVHGTDAEVFSGILPDEQQVFTVTIGDGDGDGDGDFDVDITGGVASLNLSYLDADDDDTPTEIAAGLAADYDVDADTYGIVESVSANAGVLTITLKPNPIDFSVATTITDPGNWTATDAETTATGSIGYGRFVVASGAVLGAQELALPGGSTTAPQIAGATKRAPYAQARLYNADPNAVDVYARGSAVPYVRKGLIVMKVQGSVAAAVGGAVYFGLSTAGVPGGCYASVAGSTAVALTGARFLTSGSAGDLVLVSLNLPQ